jgi:hypothetical protein
VSCRRLPESNRIRMRPLDQRGDTTGALLALEPLTYLSHQGRRDSMAARFGCNGEPIDIATPAVPSADGGTDDATIGIGRDEKNRVGSATVRRTSSRVSVSDGVASAAFQSCRTSAQSASVQLRIWIALLMVRH